MIEKGCASLSSYSEESEAIKKMIICPRQVGGVISVPQSSCAPDVLSLAHSLAL